ncbi:hypothetical protein C2E20_2984 [Micractinium conductrix]|uniref:Uncharacterized protein n=1 Tax=Micractinium conductrix TaxID=554055 RepID=A0A2P6VI24_9CHLO|nr:hypothetical protein C2E20_2984 [Micractinium conductrix]|eukprot:PSC73746.1 hypothetical protein C2E20_2984 [Micractinium conductrix]
MLLSALRTAAARSPALAPARRGLATSRPALATDRVAHGFNSPGNSGTSVEMKEAGNPEGVKENEEAVQMHQFSEKMRFDKHSFANAEKATGMAATPCDTGASEAISEASSQTEEGQTHGVAHQSPETLKHVPEGRRGLHTSTAAALQGGVPTGPEGVPTQQGGGGIDPAVGFSPPQPQANQAGGLHTWAARRPTAGGSRTLARAFQGPHRGSGEPHPTPAPEGQPSMHEAADKALGPPPNVGRESSPSSSAAEEPEREPDSLPEDMVMEERVDNPEVGGIAS